MRARLVRANRYAVPLLAGGIRHAERVALAMDARGFGAYPDRTYRRELHFHARDVAFVVAAWLVAGMIVGGLAWAGLMRPLALVS